MKKALERFTKSLLALLMFISMFAGSTYAWFSESISAKNNIITSGNLDLEMYWTDKLEGDNTVWNNVEDTANSAIFSYQNWEPGYTELKYIKIVNAGNLAFKYQMNVIPMGDVGILAEVLDVYTSAFEGVPAETVFKTRRDIESMTKANTPLSELIDTNTVITEGNLLPNGQVEEGFYSGEVVLAVALHMQEEAGNNYQNQSVGDGFSVQVIATQAEYEEDGFGKDYDANSTFPTNNLPVNISKDITEYLDANKLLEEIKISGPYGISVTLPEGVLVEDGVTSLKLTISEKETSESNVQVEQNEELKAFDVHVEGIHSDNTVPMIIKMGEVMPTGLNKGNLKLYHVENGVSNEMIQKDTIDQFGEHNQFVYEPLNGALTLNMASFSEVTVVADTENAWNGTIANDFAGGTGAEDDPYLIANADQLAYFGNLISNENENYGSAFYKLTSDINMGGEDVVDENGKLKFYPIGYTSEGYKGAFSGAFNGDGHTINDIYQNTWMLLGTYDGTYYNAAMGLFGYVHGGTVKNLTVDNFSSDGEFTPTGVIAAYADGNATFENIAITNCNPRVYNTGNGGVVGVAGDTSNADDDHLTFKNITVDNSNVISALWGSWDVACGGLVGMYRGNVDASGNATGDTISFENCHVAAQIDVYNDVCSNYQYYAYRYAGMIIGSVRHNTTNNEGKTIPNMTGISATDCTVNYGDWNDYYYCEFEENTMASYSEDYQFSRIPHSELNFADSNGNGVVDADERASVIGCKHTHTAEENHQAVYLPFHQLFTGYSWGVSSVGLKEYSGIVTDLDIIEGDQNESAEKFETKFTGDFLYRVGNKNEVAIGSLFKAIEGYEELINKSGVYVTVDKLDDSMDVSGTYTANTSVWTSGTIKFEGTGVVKVAIQDYDYCVPTVLYLEVVDAYNRTTASFGGNSVLLNDVSTSSTLSTSGVIYGNGFTVNMEEAPITEKNGAVFHLYDGAILKNLGIVGKEFTTVAKTVNDTDYGVSAVRTWGTVIIENCFISGCRSAVSVTGTELTIKDSVIANGVYANVDFRSGVLNLHNVTTINEPHEVNGTTIVGLGIVGNMTTSAGRQINITGTLDQYNWVSQADCSNIKATGLDSIFNSVFTDDKYASLRYSYNGSTYVNAGILSLCNDFGATAATGIPSNYGGLDVTATISGVTAQGYVWAPNQAGTLIDDDMKYHDEVYDWTSLDQGTSYIPSAFNYSKAGLTAENDVVQIEYEKGSSYTLSKETIETLFSAKKYDASLDYKVSMDGTDYTNEDIVFDSTSSQNYTIKFTVTDNLVYGKDGKLCDETFEVTKELNVFATVVDKGADAPTFTFYYGTNGSASAGTPHTAQPTNNYTSTIKQVGETYYIMPNVSATTANAIGSQTVSGQTIYYPIVDGINVRSGNSTDYDFTRYYPIFKGVKISDNGTEYSYSGTTEMPATVAWVEATIDSGNGASSLNVSFGLYNNQYLCKIQKKAGDEEAGGTSVVKYSYTALDGNTYYYYVGYRFYDEDEGGLCLASDTLITLAGGVQKRIDEVTYEDEVLVWDSVKGQYTTSTASIIKNHGYDMNEVITLVFENGTEINVVNAHGFFDADLNKWIDIHSGNAKSLIGHYFVKADDESYSTVKLTDVEVRTEYIEAWSILTVEHYNCIAENMFTITPPATEQLAFFEYGDNLTYDEEKMLSDIQEYGLFTYDEFSDVMSYDQYKAFHFDWIKIAIGKGLITREEIDGLINTYIK